MYTHTDFGFTYEPHNFFEAPTQVSLAIGVAVIEGGKVVVSVPEPQSLDVRSLAREVTAALRSVFRPGNC